MDSQLNKRESISISRGAYEILVAQKNKMNDKGIPASLGAIASELIVTQLGNENGGREEK